MSVLIHGKKYYTVADRIAEAGADFKSLNTEVLQHTPVVVIKAMVITAKGTFTGISAANPSKSIEKQSPYEVAETSAVGRALGFAGYKIEEGIATAEELKKAGTTESDEMPPEPPFEDIVHIEPTDPKHDPKCKDCGSVMVIGRNGDFYCKKCYIAWAEKNKPKK